MEKRSRSKKKYKRSHWTVMVLTLLGAVMLFGCGQRELSEISEKEISGGSAVLSEILPSDEEPAVREIATAPLLTYEDPESENLAGMLQNSCGGMMVQLQAGRFLGSGILYKKEEDMLVILTASHVLSDASDGVRIIFVDGWETESTDYELSELTDLAVVRVPMSQIPAERLGEYFLANVDKISFDGIQAEDGCIVMGCRTGVAEDAYEGVVLEPWIYMEDYEQYMMWVNAAGKSGMSGGGLFDRQGHFLGVLSGRSEEGQWAVVPLSFVLTEYES